MKTIILLFASILVLNTSVTAVVVTETISPHTATLKIAPSVPVTYHLEAQSITKNKDSNGKFSEIGNGFINLDITALISKNSKTDLVVTPKRFEFMHKALGFNLGFNSDKIETGNLPYLQSYKDVWNTPVKFPITTDISVLKSPSPEYPILPLDNPEEYAKFAGHILSLISTGKTYEKGQNLWVVDESDAEKEWHSKGVVKDVNEKSVVISINFNGKTVENAANKEDGQFPAILSGDMEATISRDNILIVQASGKSKVNVKLDTENDLETNITFKLSSKK